MAEEQNTVNSANQPEQAGCFGIGISFLIPIIGIILYFMKKDETPSAKNYLIAAVVGFGLNLIIGLFGGAMQAM